MDRYEPEPPEGYDEPDPDEPEPEPAPHCFHRSRHGQFHGEHGDDLPF